MKRNIFLTAALLLSLHAFSGNRYWIYFTEKGQQDFDLYGYFDARTIEKRISLRIPLSCETDFPVNPEFLKSVEKITTGILFESRWLNAVAVEAGKNQLAIISQLPFVKSIEPVGRYKVKRTKRLQMGSSIPKMDLLMMQTSIMGKNIFHENGINGKGIRIAVLDAGFRGADTHPAFTHLRDNNQILETYDFVRNKENVYSFNTHGTSVLSCIAGMYDSIPIGLATGAEFLLARTEVSWEPFFEEINWMAAMEWADKNCAYIINSSLGYTYHRYFPHQMDGKSTFITKAARIAASKGILVINSMGNDGNSNWKFAGAPADAEEVLSIGGIDPKNLLRINFSSFGPNASMRMKPNVSALGEVFAAGKKGFKRTFGTSFSAPLVTGFAACLWQANPELNSRELFALIQQSGNLYPYYDYAHGYGIPTIKKYDMDCKVETVSFGFDGKYLTLKFRRLDSDNDTLPFANYLYYHIEREGILWIYGVMEVEEDTEEMSFISIDKFSFNDIIRVHYQGVTNTFSFSDSKNLPLHEEQSD